MFSFLSFNKQCEEFNRNIKMNSLIIISNFYMIVITITCIKLNVQFNYFAFVNKICGSSFLHFHMYIFTLHMNLSFKGKTIMNKQHVVSIDFLFELLFIHYLLLQNFQYLLSLQFMYIIFMIL